MTAPATGGRSPSSKKKDRRWWLYGVTIAVVALFAFRELLRLGSNSRPPVVVTNHGPVLLPPGPPRIIRWSPVTTVTGMCCWNRARQSCSQDSDCDPGGEGCVNPGTWTAAYGHAVCLPSPHEHMAFLSEGGAGQEVARQVTGRELPPRRPSDPTGMTYLLIDMHGGALADTLGFMHNVIKVPRSNLYYMCMWTPYCRFIRDRGWAAEGPGIEANVHKMAYDSGYPGAVSYAVDANTMLPLLHIINLTSASGSRWPFHDFVTRARAWSARRLPNAAPLVDVVICNVGAEACLAMEPFAAHIIVRATHRFDHASCGSGDNWLQAGGPDRWLTGFRTGRMLQRLSRSPHHSVSAGQLFDAAYQKHWTGADSWIWSLSAPYATANYAPAEELRGKILILPNWPVDPKNNWAHWLRELRVLMNRHDLQLDTPHAYWRGNFTHEQLMQHRVAISIPYSVGSQLWLEMYRMGMPMFAPTINLMAQLHLKNGMVFHRCCELRAHCPKPCYEPEDFGQNQSATWKKPDVFGGEPSDKWLPRFGDMTEEATQGWLSMLEHYYLPHIEFFDSFPGLLRRLTSITDAELQERSRLQRRAALELEARTADRVRSKLKALSDAGPAPPVSHHPVDEFPIGLPRCAMSSSDRTNFREHGQWLGT